MICCGDSGSHYYFLFLIYITTLSLYVLMVDNKKEETKEVGDIMMYHFSSDVP